MIAPAWIAVDWGTTHLRAWAIGSDGAVLSAAQSDDGMGRLAADGFEPALLKLIEGWIDSPTHIVACGMVGSRQGWVDAGYRPVPAPPLGGPLALAPARDTRLIVHIVPGLKQDKPADVMRGEETQIAGFLALNPGFDGVLCLPGTHTKWAHISAGEVVSFASFMTGEVFSLLSQHSVLRHSMGEAWSDAAFAEALSDAMARPERLAGHLFGIRASGLLGQSNSAEARARLSGLLIGAELAAARPYWLGQNVAVIGAPGLADLYAQALTAQGAAPVMTDAEAMTQAGLAAARVLLKETAQ